MIPPIPPIIYSLWLQGLGQAPPIVRLNFERWQQLNPNHRLKVLDHAAVQALLGYLPVRAKDLAPQALSDVLRAFLLRSTGGIWVDASIFPAVPLDDWLPANITPSGFFAFEKPGPDRPLSSWFLAVSERNSLMEKWWRKTNRYWSVSRDLVDGIPENPVAAVTVWNDRYPYFWFHYLFRDLLENDNNFAESWAKCSKLSAHPPHQLQASLAQDQNLDSGELAKLAVLAPVHKLNWRAPYPIEMLRELKV